MDPKLGCEMHFDNCDMVAHWKAMSLVVLVELEMADERCESHVGFCFVLCVCCCERMITRLGVVLPTLDAPHKLLRIEIEP